MKHEKNTAEMDTGTTVRLWPKAVTMQTTEVEGKCSVDEENCSVGVGRLVEHEIKKNHKSNELDSEIHPASEPRLFSNFVQSLSDPSHGALQWFGKPRHRKSEASKKNTHNGDGGGCWNLALST